MKKRSRHNKRRCMWFGCNNPYMAADDINMCLMHARTIHERMQQREDLAVKRAQLAFEKRNEVMRRDQLARVLSGRPQVDRILGGDIPQQWVYYIRIDGKIKIGYTSDIAGRFRSYPPTMQILGIEYGDKELEKQRHAQFSAYLAYGREWFHDTQEIREHIATLPRWQHLVPKRMRRGPANQASRVQPRYWSGK